MNIKKTLSFLLALLMITACGTAFARDLTMKEFMDANSTKSLLARHSSVALLQTLNDGQNAVWVNSEYRYTARRQDKTVRSGDSEYLATDQYLLLLSYVRFADGVFPIPALLLDIGLGDSPLYDLEAGYGTDLLYDTETTAKEEVQSVVEQDGRVVMTTRLTGQDFKDAWEGDFEEGCYAELVYTLDAETLELLEDVEKVMAPDGHPLAEDRQYKRSDVTVETGQRALYDVPMPDEVNAMLKMLDAYLNGPEEERRTVTFILDPGTSTERRFTTTGAKGYGIAVYGGGYEYDLYTDAAMTQEAQPDDYISDRIYYVKVYSLEDDI